ncbi:hypothetical protein DXG01_009013 [Tephrocybe rancida]|nr:hypothetical protein DXG01_009013 [Tephrocybe rancida]
MSFRFPRLRRRSKPPPFPPEIFERILAHCGSRDQRKCSLAASFLQFPAQRALFHKVTILLSPTSRLTNWTTIDNFLASNPRLASYVRHLSLGISPASEPPKCLPHLSLSGLRALTLYADSLTQSDWRALPAVLTDALYTLIQARELRTLELRNIAHFPLAVALPLDYLIIRLGSGPFDTTTSVSHSPRHHLQSLRVESHAILRTLIDVPFLSISRLIRFEAFANNVDTLITIQHVLHICAETLQVFHLDVYRDKPFTHPLTLTLLKSLTTLHLPVHFSCPDAFPWCTHTLSTLPLPISSPTIALTLQATGSLPDTDADWSQIDRLPVRTLHIHRETRPQYDIHELEELLPGLAGRNAIVGSPPPPPPMEVQKPTTMRSSVWKRARGLLG